MDKLRILLADDSVLSRKAVAEAVEGTGTGRVEHTAPNGSIAMEWLEQSDIDVVLLDAFIPGQDSLKLLGEIREKHPDVEVIMLSDGEPRCAEVTIEALAAGAFDFVLKPADPGLSGNIERLRNQLEILFTQIKVKKYSRGLSEPGKSGSASPDGERYPYHGGRVRKTLQGRPEIILIAASTGGPAAMETLLESLPADFPCPILAVQHMPPDFTGIFARTLDKKSAVRVREAKNGDIPEAGKAIIAAGGLHMTVRKSKGRREIRLEDSPYVNGVRPSADVLFNSAAKAYEGKDVLAVILTGMGNDGMQGVIELKKYCRCYCITQSEETCVVYGMPRCAAEAGLSDETCDLGNIAGRLCQIAAIEG